MVGCSELAGSLFISVRISGLGNFLEQAKFYLPAFGHFNLVVADNMFVTHAP